MPPPAPSGQRHDQLISLVCQLLIRGYPPTDVFRHLRDFHQPPLPESEVRAAITWASQKVIPQTRWTQKAFPATSWQQSAKPPTIPPVERVKTFLGTHPVTSMDFADLEAELWEASPIHPPDDWQNDLQLMLACLYEPEDSINIVSEYREEDGKVKPGIGETRSRKEWLSFLKTHPIPSCAAGGWIRMNPVVGGVADENVTAFHFALLECDNLPLDMQLRLFTRLLLPITAIITSGGRSIHAWVRVDAADETTYRTVVSRMFGILIPFGVDKANRNPSRLSRLPGVVRKMGTGKDPRQRLLYFAPDKTASTPIFP